MRDGPPSVYFEVAAFVPQKSAESERSCNVSTRTSLLSLHRGKPDIARCFLWPCHYVGHWIHYKTRLGVPVPELEFLILRKLSSFIEFVLKNNIALSQEY